MAQTPKPGNVLFRHPVSCMNYDGGHDHQYKLSVNIKSANVDPMTGAMSEDVKKEYVLELVCRHCSDRKTVYRKEVGFTENVTMAQMLTEHKAKLAEAYYASQAVNPDAPNRSGR